MWDPSLMSLVYSLNYLGTKNFPLIKQYNYSSNSNKVVSGSRWLNWITSKGPSEFEYHWLSKVTTTVDL